MMRIAALLGALTLSACAERVEAPADAYAVPGFEWRIRTADQLREVYAVSGMPLRDGHKLHGFVGVTPDGLNVIYTERPRTVDDSVACTLGHEVMHLALGDYHGSNQ